MRPHDATIPIVQLPPSPAGPLADLIVRRHSTRDFASTSLSPDDLAALLLAGYGHRRDGGGIIPSAHGLRPLSLVVLVGRVDGVPAGAYRYRPVQHDLATLRAGDHRDVVARASLADGHWLAEAAALIVITGDLESARHHFYDQPPRGARGERYVWLEAGHVSQNLYLTAADRGLGVVLVAGFHDDRLTDALRPADPADAELGAPLGIIAVGVPAETAPADSEPTARHGPVDS